MALGVPDVYEDQSTALPCAVQSRSSRILIHFAVVVGESPSAVDRARRRVSRALDRSRLFEGEQVMEVAPSGGWAAAAISAPDPTCSVRLSVDGESMTVLNGPAFTPTPDSLRLVESVRNALVAGRSSAASAQLRGAYNVVGVTSAGLHAFTDFSGLFPLYWRQERDTVIFSNRCTCLEGNTSEQKWDLRALAWIIGHANLFGGRMPMRGVSYLLPGTEAHVDRGTSRVRLRESDEWIWPSPSQGSLREDLTLSEWDGITETLVENFRDLHRLDSPIQLMLSGGKDSRLCLALAKAAGLEDKIVCITNGAPDGPEVRCAAAVAEVAGFRHELGALNLAANAPSNESASPHADEWQRLRQHVYRYEAIVCPRDGTTESLSTTTLSIKGFGGELYRRGHAQQFKRRLPSTVDEMAASFVNYHQKHDPLGVLQPEETSFQATWLTEWVHEAARHVRLDLLPEKFYVDFRLGHWNGPLGQATPADIKLNPLLSPAVAMKYMELSPQTRATDRLHFEVMRRTAHELLEVPVLNDVWASEIVSKSPQLPTEPFPSDGQVSARTLRSRRWDFLETERDAIEQLFEDADHNTGMGSICNMEKLKAIVRARRELRNIDVKAVESSIAVAIALLGREEAVFDRP
jgi:hypothetical protein